MLRRQLFTHYPLSLYNLEQGDKLIKHIIMAWKCVPLYKVQLKEYEVIYICLWRLGKTLQLSLESVKVWDIGTHDRQMEKREQRKWKCIMYVLGKSDFQEFYFSITGHGKDENKATCRGKFKSDMLNFKIEAIWLIIQLIIGNWK